MRMRGGATGTKRGEDETPTRAHARLRASSFCLPQCLGLATTSLPRTSLRLSHGANTPRSPLPALRSPSTNNMVILARTQGRERAAVPSRSSENWRGANGIPRKAPRWVPEYRFCAEGPGYCNVTEYMCGSGGGDVCSPLGIPHRIVTADLRPRGPRPPNLPGPDEPGSEEVPEPERVLPSNAPAIEQDEDGRLGNCCGSSEQRGPRPPKPGHVSPGSWCQIALCTFV